METWAVLLALLAVAAVAAFFLLGRSSGKGGSDGPSSGKGSRPILLVGPNNAGKTTLHQKMARGVAVETVNSVSEHRFTGILKDPSTDGGDVEGQGVKATLVDVPGFPQFREKAVSMAASSAGVVFTIDSSAGPAHFKAAADWLYELLTSPAVVDAETPLLIACNKQDVPGARTVDAVKALLETELELLKVSRPSIQTLDGTANIQAAQKKSGRGGGRGANADGSAPAQLLLGREGDKFSFEEDAPLRVQWCGCVVNAKANSAKGGKQPQQQTKGANLGGVYEFIRDCCSA